MAMMEELRIWRFCTIHTPCNDPDCEAREDFYPAPHVRSRLEAAEGECGKALKLQCACGSYETEVRVQKPPPDFPDQNLEARCLSCGNVSRDGINFASALSLAEARLSRLEEALRGILNELGVPSGDYAAPVANAIYIAREALSPSRDNEQK